MFLLILFTFLIQYFNPVISQSADVITNPVVNGNTTTNLNTSKILENGKVEIKFYYETLCPFCRKFVTRSLVPTVEQLSQYLDIKLYPYGNAKTNETQGNYTFECQHGPTECYGNMLDACAIDIIGSITKAIYFNGCMMEKNQSDGGSNDIAADKCGTSLNIDADPIKLCAKSDQGIQLLKYYGDESKEAGFVYVPYVLVNGVENNRKHFMKDICALISDPPPPCKEILSKSKV